MEYLILQFNLRAADKFFSDRFFAESNIYGAINIIVEPQPYNFFGPPSIAEPFTQVVIGNV